MILAQKTAFRLLIVQITARSQGCDDVSFAFCIKQIILVPQGLVMIATRGDRP